VIRKSGKDGSVDGNISGLFDNVSDVSISIVSDEKTSFKVSDDVELSDSFAVEFVTLSSTDSIVDVDICVLKVIGERFDGTLIEEEAVDMFFTGIVGGIFVVEVVTIFEVVLVDALLVTAAFDCSFFEFDLTTVVCLVDVLIVDDKELVVVFLFGIIEVLVVSDDFGEEKLTLIAGDIGRASVKIAFVVTSDVLSFVIDDFDDLFDVEDF
jgi:hypothetical protein